MTFLCQIMEYKCFICSKLFEIQKEIVKHLKKDHFVKENKDPIYCIKNNNCKKYFHNFRNLKFHSENCTDDIEQQV